MNFLQKIFKYGIKVRPLKPVYQLKKGKSRILNQIWGWVFIDLSGSGGKFWWYTKLKIIFFVCLLKNNYNSI